MCPNWLAGLVKMVNPFFNLWRAFWNIRPYSNLWHAIWTSLAFVGSLAVWIFWDINFPPFFVATVVFGMLAITLWIVIWKERRDRRAGVYNLPRWDPLTPWADWEGRPPNDPDYEGWDPDGGPSRDEVDWTNDPKG